MNKNGVKLLAAIAVFAMMAAALVVGVSGESSATPTFSTTDSDDSFTISYNTGMSVEKINGKYVFEGIAYTDNTTRVNSSVFGTTPNTYAYAYITIPDFTGESKKYWVEQTNTALSVYGVGGNISNDSGTWVKAKATTFTSGDKCLYFLIPKDGSSVNISFYDCTGDTKGDLVKSINMDFSKVSTKVILDNADIGDDTKLNNDGWKYDWNDSDKGTLYLKDYSRLEVFSSSRTIDVKLQGSNTINNYGIVKGDSAIITSGVLSILLNSSDAAASLDINVKNNNAFGIQSSGAMYIGSNTTAVLNLDITGSPNRGIYAIGGLTTQKTTIDVVGSEKAIRVGGTGSATDLTVSAGSTINATLSIPESHNAEGDDDYCGIKTEGEIASIGSESVVTTQGLNTTKITNITGKLIVTGDYIQNPNAGTKVPVAGLYVSGSDQVNVNRVDSANGTADGKIYIVGDAETYGPVVVTTGTTVTETVVTDVSTITNSFGTADKVTFNGAISASNVVTVTVPEGKELVFTDNVSNANMTIEVKGDVVIPTGVSITAKISNGTNTASLSGVSGQFTISEGSIHMSGSYQGTLDNLKGDLVLSGSTSSDLNINVQAGQTATITFADGFINTHKITITGTTGTTGSVVKIIEGSTVKTDGEIELRNNIQMNVSGSLIGTGSVDAYSTDVKVYVDSGAIFSVTPTGNAASFNITDSVKEFHISQDIVSDLTTNSQQKVYIDKSITIYNGAKLTIAGDLEVAEGMKITIKDGGKLYVNGINAVAVIAGDIVIEGKDGFEFNGKTMTVDGTITVKADSNEAALNISAGKTEINGEIVINTKASATFTDGITVMEGGKLTINGTISGNVAANYGLVYVNGTVGSSFTVYMQVGATVNVVSVTGTLTVSDNGMIIKKNVVVGTTGLTANTMELKNVKGLSATANYTSKTDGYGQKVYTNKLFVSGTAVAVKGLESSAEIKTTAGTITVSETLDIGKVKVTVANTSKLSVTGSIMAVSTENQSIAGTGTFDVTGTVKSYGTLTIGKINAVHYQIKEGDVAYEIYTNLADAIASGVSALDVLGNITISKDTTIPKGIAVDASSSDVTVKDEATLTVADGGEFSARKIDVKGTLVVENNEGLSCSNIISDVSSKTETTSKYTNIYIALSSAQSGETVKITKKGDGNVILSKDAVIGTGVILEVPSEKTLIINEGVKLTVNGTLYINNGSLEANKLDSDEVYNDGEFGTVVFIRGAIADLDKYYAVVEVTGTIVSSDSFDYSKYKIPGAYYSVKNKYYVTTIETAAKEILNAEDYTVNINGKNTVGAVAFEGKDGKEIIVNVNNGELIAEKMTVSFGKIVFVDSSTDTGVTVVSGTFGSALGTITFENTKVFGTTAETVVKFTIEDKLNADDEQIVCYYGNIYVADSNKDASVVINGKVTALASTIDLDGDEVIVDSNAVLTVSGNATITDADFTINGEVVVDNTFTLTAGTVAVLGTLTVKEKTDRLATANTDIDILIIGGTVGDFDTGASASVNGNVSADVVKLFPGSTVSGILNEKITAADVVSSEFFVEGKLWMTVYNFSGSDVNFISSDEVQDGYKPVISEAKFDYWYTVVDGKNVKVDGTNAIGADGYKTMYAAIEYNVYDVQVQVAEGVDDVYVDGVLMAISDNYFTATVTAGQHTISYTLANGYSGEAVMLVNGEKVTGYKFTASGDFNLTAGEVEYKIILQGIEKSGYVPDSPDTPAEDKGMGITDYLLIVLVILAAILVVIVAIRMMRS